MAVVKLIERESETAKADKDIQSVPQLQKKKRCRHCRLNKTIDRYEQEKESVCVQYHPQYNTLNFQKSRPYKPLPATQLDDMKNKGQNKI